MQNDRNSSGHQVQRRSMHFLIASLLKWPTAPNSDKTWLFGLWHIFAGGRHLVSTTDTARFPAWGGRGSYRNPSSPHPFSTTLCRIVLSLIPIQRPDSRTFRAQSIHCHLRGCPEKGSCPLARRLLRAWIIGEIVISQASNRV